MNFENKSFNANLNKLMKSLNSLEIMCESKSINSLEIFFDDNQKELVLNMVSQVNSDKNGFVFNVRKSGDKKTKSILITFFRNMDLSCKLLDGFLHAENYSYCLNAFNKLDIILDSFPYDNITLSIQKNMDIKDGYLVTFNQTLTNEQINGNDNIVLNNEELKSRLIHTIYSKNEDNTYNATYGIIYSDENDLNNLLVMKNTNTVSKKLVRTNTISKSAILNK